MYMSGAIHTHVRERAKYCFPPLFLPENKMEAACSYAIAVFSPHGDNCSVSQVFQVAATGFKPVIRSLILPR